MSGDLRSEENEAHPDGEPASTGGGRPDFLPPSDAHAPLYEEAVPPAQPFVPLVSGAPPAEPLEAEAPGRPERDASRPPLWSGGLWNVAVMIAAAFLLVAAFLPWVRAQIVIDAFGETLTRDLGVSAGIDADGVVAAIPVLALAALGMAFWGLVAGDQRFSSFTAIPGGLALLTCGIFLLRLGSAHDELVGDDVPFGYDITPAYGWYLAVASSLLVLGFALVRPIVARVSGAGPRQGRDGGKQGVVGGSSPLEIERDDQGSPASPPDQS
jgi:hypothetical protein